MPDFRPKVSIVIPTYDQAALLREALNSVRAQTFTDWEAIIVNNHSTDDTRAVVEAFTEPRFRLVDFANHGVIAASRNKAIELAGGEWIAFLDSDDLWAPEKLERCLAAGDGADLVSHREATMRDGAVVRLSPLFRPANAAYRRLLFSGNCLSPSAVMVRRGKVLEAGGFSEDPELITCEDYDLWLRLARPGLRVRFIDPVLSTYRLHGGNSSASVMRHHNAGLAVIERHYRELERKRPLDALRYRKSRSRAIYGAGRSFQKTGQPAEARRFFWRSLILFPGNLRAAACLLMTGTRGAEAPATARVIDAPLLGRLAWLWVGGVLAVYLLQFRPLMVSLLDVLYHF